MSSFKPKIHKIEIPMKTKQIEGFPETFGSQFMRFKLEDPYSNMFIKEDLFRCEICMKPVFADQKLCDSCFLNQHKPVLLAKRNEPLRVFRGDLIMTLLDSWKNIKENMKIYVLFTFTAFSNFHQASDFHYFLFASSLSSFILNLRV